MGFKATQQPRLTNSRHDVLRKLLLVRLCFGMTTAAMGASDQDEAGREPEGAVEGQFYTSAATVAQTVLQICGSVPVGDALISNGLQPGEAANAAARALCTHDLSTASDLLLLGGGPEDDEFMAELKAAGVSIGNRGKIRLLVGDRAHLARLDLASSTSYNENSFTQRRRQLQTDAKADADAMSMDTLAIIFALPGTVCKRTVRNERRGSRRSRHMSSTPPSANESGNTIRMSHR